MRVGAGPGVWFRSSGTHAWDNWFGKSKEMECDAQKPRDPMGVTYYFLEDFPSNCICSFMVWVTCPIEDVSALKPTDT